MVEARDEGEWVCEVRACSNNDNAAKWDAVSSVSDSTASKLSVEVERDSDEGSSNTVGSEVGSLGGGGGYYFCSSGSG